MKKSLLTRWVSVLLTLVLIFSMVPPVVTVSAAQCAHEETSCEVSTNYNGTHSTRVVCDQCGETVQEDATQVLVDLDFKALAKEAAKQSWWNDLPYVLTANGYETRRLGAFRNQTVSDAELAAYNAMQAYLAENEGWTFQMPEWDKNDKVGKRAYLCADDGIAWGLAMHSYIINGSDSSAFRWSIDVPETGFYDLTLNISRQDNASSDNPGDTNIFPGGASIDVYANDELLLDNSEVAKGTGMVEHTIERVYLEQGKNTLRIELVSNYANISGFGSRTNLNLKSIELAKAQNCTDENGDDICDVCHGSLLPCAHDGETLTDTVYNGNKTHTTVTTCDLCREQIGTETVTCSDEDEDGKCDICTGKIGECKHKGETKTAITYNNDGTHTTKVTCLVCKGTASSLREACVDAGENGICDICEGVLGECKHKYYSDVFYAYGNGTHLVEETCDGCGIVGETYTADCIDQNADGICDSCRGSMGQLVPDTITLDFKEFAKLAQQQPFWADLRTAINEDTKYIGLDRGTDTTTAKEQAAYDEMIAWAQETFGWTINEEISGFKHYFKRLYLNGQDNIPWGIDMYTYYHATGTYPECSKLALTVHADVAGWYQLDLSSFLMESAWPNAGNTIEGGSSGGDRVAVYVNGEEIFYDYSMVGKYLVVTDNMGAAYLRAGENTVVIDSIFSYNNLGVGGRSNVPLVEMSFHPLNGVQVQEYLTASIDLKKTYLAYQAQTGSYEAVSANDLIATAALSAGGILTVTGVTQGTTLIRIMDGETVVCTVPVCVNTFEGSLDELRGSAAKIDFMAFADRAAEQAWWQTLPETEEGIRTVTMQDTPVFGWLDENTRWNMTGMEGGVTINGGSAKYGVGVDGTLQLQVDIPAEGSYNLTVEYLTSEGSMDISVNGSLVREALSLSGSGTVVKRSIGQVSLSKGSNTILVEAQTAALRSVTLTPLGMRQVEVGGEQYVSLSETYFAFDDDVSDLTVTSSAPQVAAASFDADGELIIRGVSEGTATLTVSGAASFTIPVQVVSAGRVEYVTYTLDDFRAVTMKRGETAVGNVTGMTTQQTPLTEKYIRNFGSVYFASSDRSVATVDQTTGDVTCVAEGTAVITVYTLIGGVNSSASVTLTVTDDTDLDAIEISAVADYLGVDNAMQLAVNGTKTSGAAANMNNFPIAWSVDDETVAVISDTGRLTGLKPGTVTVTATAGVARMPVTDTMVIQVVENSALAGDAVMIQLDAGRVLDLYDVTLERDGYELVEELTYNGGEGMIFDAQGLRFKVPAEATLTIDFVVKKTGWYQPFVQAKQLKDAGSICNVFVDDSYIGRLDSRSANSNGGAGGFMNAIWLQAGTHRLQVVSTMEAMLMLGRAHFYPTVDPGSVEITMEAKEELVVGETAELKLSLQDGSARAFTLLQHSGEAAFTNYYSLSSSAANVVMVSGTTLRAVAPGTAVITLTGELLGEPVEHQLTITVKAGSFISAELTAESTTVKPQTEPFALQVITYDRGGNAQETIPETVTISYESADETIASVSEDGIVTLTGKEGSVLLTAYLTEEDRTVAAAMWLVVTKGKTEPTVFTNEERSNAQENVLKYSWAWNEKEAAVADADYYVENLDRIYDMWIYDTFPRTTRVAFKGDNNYRYCDYCGVDLVGKYGAYPWIIDPIENPWKVTCPECRRDFPSNDFGAYFESGLGEDGRFHEELADKSLLVNTLYPEKGEGWGVDDGWGYDTGTGTTRTYITHYLGNLFSTMSSPHCLDTILPTLMNAYLYTGDEKYGSAGAILVDRLADIYPEYDCYQYDWQSYNSADGGSGHGKFIGITWDGILSGTLARAVDVFWPSASNPDVIEYLRARASEKGVAPEDITPDYLRDHAEQGILMEIFRAASTYWIDGNFGMSEAGVAYAAASLNREPETSMMMDWLWHSQKVYGSGYDYTNEGGDIMRRIMENVSRDGFGDEGSFSYNALWEDYLLDVADALEGMEDYNLWKNSKFLNLYLGSMRLTICGRMTPAIHEGGMVQGGGTVVDINNMMTAFLATGDHELARAIYAANGNTVDGLHGDIFTPDPEEGVRNRINQIVAEEGEWDMSDSDMLCGYGIAILREGPSRFLGKNVNGDQFSDYWMGFGYTDVGHAQLETLNIDVEAFGLTLSSSMGYPLVVQATDPMRMQWVNNTVSNNTVVVNDKGQAFMDEAAFPLHFADDGKAKVIDIDGSLAYEETDIYRRTLVAVENGDGVHYAVDFFRVLGGSEHVYSFHGATRIQPETTGLEMIHQPMGTYAGPDIPYGDHQISGKAEADLNQGSGYSWLEDVYRDADPETTFSVDFAIEDLRNQLVTSAGIHLKLTMMSEEPMTEVALANGIPPQNGSNPDHVEYMLVRRSGEPGMDTLFTTVIEPYQNDSYIASTELVEVTLLSGTQQPSDRAAAIKVTLTSGREDYIVYATNSGCTYDIGGKFTFRGFAGVVSYEGGSLVYAWGNDATQVADVIHNDLPAVTGSVTDFTHDLAERYSITVQLDQAVSADALTDHYIYVNNDGLENAVYRIYGAEVDGRKAVLDLKHLCLVREFVDEFNMDLGYVHNIAEGQTFSIPQSAVFDVEELFRHTADQVVKTGYQLSLQVGVPESGAIYEVQGLAGNAKLNASTGRLTWTPSKTQSGRYPVVVTAKDENGNVLGTMEFVVYVVAYTGASYDPSVCKHVKALTYTVDGVDETVCPACGTITKSEPEEEPIETIAIAGTNMNLGNELAVNFMFPKSLDASKSYTAIITQTSQGKVVKTTEIPS
ncbi:MAG: Ig-like domain-containing protein, partial [Oscillospiraceae bacterium]|nr:Ig-like domain-containing protein [Oscillospiraceae bacterium]